MLSGDALKRIAAAVQSYEHGDRKQSPIKFRIPVGDDGETVVRMASFSLEWRQGADKTIIFSDDQSEATATNSFMTLPGDGGECAVFKDHEEKWQLLEASNACVGGTDAGRLDSDGMDNASTDEELSAGAGVQVLINVSGCCKWFYATYMEVVTDVRWESGLVVEKKPVFVLNHMGEASETTIIGETECGS
jgi:hypothetical protein